jgi:putative endonuclease
MAGLVPAIHADRAISKDDAMIEGGWVYIMTNRPNGTLYTGVTNNLLRRVWEHREGVADGFTRRCSLKRLVYFERHETITAAIQREHNIKHWPRRWKAPLILAANPVWNDLYGEIAGHVGAGPSPAMTMKFEMFG